MTASVGSKNSIPLLQSQFFKLNSLVVRGVIYENVQASQFLDRLLERRSDTFQVRHIAAQRYGAKSEAGQIDNGMLGLTAGFQERDGNVGSGISQGQSNGATQAARTAGNQGGLAFQRLDRCFRHVWNCIGRCVAGALARE